MIISLNWLKKFTRIDLSIDDLATLIGARLVEIEEVIDLGAKYDKAFIAKVVEAGKLEGSDHLSVTKIDDGGVNGDIERDENGLIQVVCGAPNIKAGQTVVWLAPGAIVPETYNKSEQFILGVRDLRGVTSNGMIASAKELDLFEDHDGILEINDDIKPGTLFRDAYELDDYLLDIENKSLTHRPDCFGIIGFAREIAAITGQEFKTPDYLLDLKPSFDANKDVFDLNVQIDNPEISSRYLAVVMAGGDGSKKSPLSIQTYLSRVGIRPVSAVVDVTNYLMVLTGQPLHAFDYDKVVKAAGGKAEIHVRLGRDKEKLTLLDGRTIELANEDIVIAAGDTAIGLAGAMGGFDTEIDDNTKNIIIESATFNLYNLRSTQMRHGIFSEAIMRFTKGQPSELSMPVLKKAVELMNEWTGAVCVSDVAEAYPSKKEFISLEVGLSDVNGVLGSDYSGDEIMKTLRNVEFAVEKTNDDAIKIAVPYWRSDIHIFEDVVEEVGRLNGFDNITPDMPSRDFMAVKPSDFDEFRQKIRKILARVGANEVLTYSFIHGNILEKAGQKIENSYRIVNSISPELQYYRQSLTPSLLGLIHPNVKQGYDEFSLFEINKTHLKQNGVNDENVPVESNMAAFVFANKSKEIGAAYYKSKCAFEYLCHLLGLDVVFERMTESDNEPIFAPFEYRRSAKITNRKDGLLIGVVGEYKKSVVKSFKLPEYVSGFEVDLEKMFKAADLARSNYKPISRYPGTDRDICFKLDKAVDYSSVVTAANEALMDMNVESEILPIDIYMADGSDTKNITIRIKMTSHDHTLNGDEVTGMVKSIIDFVVKKTNATVI